MLVVVVCSINMVASSWVEDRDTSAAKLLNSACQSLRDMQSLLAQMTPWQPESRL